MDKAFFLDRDGTLNVDYNYVHKPEQWTWCDGAIDALEWIYNHNFKIIVVTNQSGISRGRYSEAEVDHLHQWVDKELEQRNISIDGWYYAPHHPDHDSNREYDPQDRKPGTGMFKKAAKKFNIDFNQSYMAGDKITDLQPAISVGIKPLFILEAYRNRIDPGSKVTEFRFIKLFGEPSKIFKLKTYLYLEDQYWCLALLFNKGLLDKTVFVQQISFVLFRL